MNVNPVLKKPEEILLKIEHKNLYAFLSLVVLTGLYIFFNRYGYLVGAETMLIYKVMCLRDPSLFLSDPSVLLANKSYFVFLAWPLAFLNQWFRLEWIFFIGHLLTTFFYLHAAFKLSQTLFDDEFVSFMAVLSLFVIKPVLVDASLYPTMFYHRNVAWVLQLYAVDMFLKKRLSLAMLLAGLAFDTTPYTGLHLAGMMFFALCFMRGQFSFRAIVKSLAIFAVIVFPMLAWRLSDGGGVSVLFPPAEWLDYLRKYVANYVFPSAFCHNEGGTNTVLMALVWPLLLLAPFAKRYIQWKEPHRILGLLMGGIFVLWGIGTVFTEWIPISAIIQLMMFRSQKFLVLFAILYFIYYLICRFREEGSMGGRFLLGGIVASFLCSKMILCVFLASLDVLCWALPMKKSGKNIISFTVLSGIALIAFMPAAMQPRLLDRLFHLDVTFLLLGLFTAAFLFFSCKKEPEVSKRGVSPWGGRILFSAIFFFIFFPSYWRGSKGFWHDPLKVLSAQVHWPWVPCHPQSHDSLFAWARKQTSKNAVFLIPPKLDPVLSRNFRIFSERGNPLLFEDSYGLNSADYAQHVLRFEKLFEPLLADAEKIRKDPITTEQLLMLRQKYPFDYLIMPREYAPLALPVAFQNERFTVYGINA